MMHTRKNLVALGAAVIMAACGRCAFAQEDLDDLLNDLEAEATATATAPEAVEASDEADAEQPSDEEAVGGADEEAAADEAAADADGEEPADDAEESADEEDSADEEESADDGEEPAADEESSDDAEESADDAEESADDAEESADDAEESADDAEESADDAEEPADDAEESADDAEEPADDAEEPADEEPAAADEGDVTPEEPDAEEPDAEEPAPATTPASDGPVFLFNSGSSAAPAPAAVPAAEEPEPAAEEPSDEEPSVEEPAATEPAPATKPAPAAKPEVVDPTKELIANIETTERIRREAYDLQAKREIDSARESMRVGEFMSAVRSYANARKLLTDTATNAGLRKECDQGIAEGLYRAALQEETMGRRDRAKKLMNKAVDMRHPKARRQLEVWNAEDDPNKNKTDLSEVTQRRNDQDYKDLRTKNLQHLKRSRQLLGTRELDKALEECELVLVSDPYNEAALKLRNAIQKKRHLILMKERQAAREGMIADVDHAWRPAYAVDASEVAQTKSETMKRDVGSQDPTRAQEQNIIKRMKEMRLPSISFQPPATIIDAVEFFRGASRDFDRPEIPLEQRGFNFVLKTPETLRASAPVEEEESGGFGADSSEDSGSAQTGVPVIPMISASDITFYEALKLVCDSVGYKFKVQGPIVMVMDKDMSIDEMLTRSYSVVAAFMERMGAASSDLKEMKSAGFGGSSNRRNNDDGEENQERDWKAFFEELGVKWPEGSSIMYLKTIGKLRVKNTYENLAELEKALVELNASPRLIEIETRFVEVCQEDLNSLGFEWILNSDYTIGLGKHVSRALGLRKGAWGSQSGSSSYSSTTTLSSGTSGTTSSGSNNGGVISMDGGTTTLQNTTLRNQTVSDTTTFNRTIYHGNSKGANWIRNGSASHGGLGMNAIGGDSAYQTNMRYLSTDSNHISGESNSTNDQFFRVNAFLGSADLSMILHMLSQRSDTDLLSAPKVLTRNGEEAIIKVVTEYIYPTDYEVQLQSSSSSSSSSSGGSQSAILAIVKPDSFTMREVGVILDVTPTLTDDGHLIDLKLNTQVVDEPTWKNYGMRIPFTGNSNSSDITFPELPDVLGDRPIGEEVLNTIYTAWANTITKIADAIGGTSQNITYYDAPMEQPFFHVRSIDTSVSVYPGATIVMGGLITEQRKAMDDKIPFLGDLPFIGRLFRSHSEQTSKRNLLIFVTTRLVDVHGREVEMNESEQSETDVKPDVAEVE